MLHSQTDAVVPVLEGRKLAAAIPGSRYIEYEDLPHTCFTTDCEQLVSDIEEFVTGERSESAEDADRVLAVLFTDIVNSTTRAIDMGDRRWREVLDSHDRLAKQRVERQRGRLMAPAAGSLRARAWCGGAADRATPTRRTAHRRDRGAR